MHAYAPAATHTLRVLRHRRVSLTAVVVLVVGGMGLADLQHIRTAPAPKPAPAVSSTAPELPELAGLYVDGEPWQIALTRARARELGAGAGPMQSFPRHPEP